MTKPFACDGNYTTKQFCVQSAILTYSYCMECAMDKNLVGPTLSIYYIVYNNYNSL